MQNFEGCLLISGIQIIISMKFAQSATYIMKKLSLLYLSFMAALALLLPALTVTAAAAGVDIKSEAQCQKTDTTECIPAQTDTATSGDCNKDNGCDIIGKYVNPLIKLLSIVVGLAVTVGIVWGGIEYASSGGDPQKSARGKGHIVKSLVGLVGFFFLFAAIKFLTPGGI